MSLITSYIEKLNGWESTINHWEAKTYNRAMEPLYDTIQDLADNQDVPNQIMARAVAVPTLVLDTVLSAVFAIAQVVQNVAFAILYTLGGEGREGLAHLWEAGVFLVLGLAMPVLIVRQAWNMFVDPDTVDRMMLYEVSRMT
jgi:hypothetical protein